MKFLSTIQFLAITTLASPITLKQTQTLEIQNLSANHYSNVTLSNLQFTLHNPTINIIDNCNMSWNTSSEIQPGLAPQKCQRGQFEFGFRYGIGDIERFTLVVQQVNGSAQGSSVVSAYRRDPDWICLWNPVRGIQEHCVWNGILRVEV
ncbi:hypothetical protein PENDEC_c009G00854 [Penicillium decumbens]|uniref:AA1-like domain-containing protein n=1 Tax=Penicillium decumbens TaxID=69771 RepID=A0A1V6PDU6_PENDC|nr:hypothetical protein PENDEC_c009G00854 [Penicillium decumbens]